MLYCKKCGNKLEDGANFCPKCGCPTESTLVNDSDTIVDNGKFAPNVQVQPTNQFEASTGEKSKLGCWSKILYTFLFFILIGFLAEECGGGDTNMDESNAPQATENVKSGGGGDTNMDESNAPQATENVKVVMIVSSRMILQKKDMKMGTKWDLKKWKDMRNMKE